MKADAISVLAHALSPGHLGAKGFRIVMETVDEGGKEWRLLQSASGIRQSESDRADRREHGLVSSSTTNEWNSRLPFKGRTLLTMIKNRHSK